MSNKKDNKKEKEVSKIESLNAEVKYEGEGELISDISSSKPLVTEKKKTEKKKTEKKKTEKKNVDIVKKPTVEEIVDSVDTNITVETFIEEIDEQAMFNNILNSGEAFYLKHGNTIIYDSIKNNNDIVVFQSDHVVINNQIFPYIGMKLKFKK